MRLTSNSRPDTVWGYAFLAPSLAVLAVFSLYPIGLAIYMSLFECSYAGKTVTFVGLGNFADALRSAEFWSALKVTVFYAAGTIPVTLLLSFVIANFLFLRIRGRAFYRSGYFLPFITSAIAAAAVWKWVFHNQHGIVNMMLNALGIPPQQWLRELRGIFTVLFEQLGVGIPSWAGGPSMALCCVMIYSIWHSLGFCIVVFLGGLSNVPTEMYDAARIDGAGFWKTMWSVTFPMIGPTFYFLVMISTIGAFQAFTPIFIMSGEKPGESMTNLTVLIFKNFYVNHERTGYATGLAIILFAIILALTGLQARLAGRRVHYA